MTRLERFFRTLTVVLLPSPGGRHHRVAPPPAVPYDAETVAIPRINAHPYKQETR